ncbi:MAG TPA: TonB family protein [Nitrospira sp.]|nr:TonB family protein [Nitrospira sp.]
MRSTNEYSFRLLAWGVSLAIHGGVVWFAIVFTAQVRPVLNEEIFKWDVALVEPMKTDALSETAPVPVREQVEQVVSTVQPPPRAAALRPVEPPSDTVIHTIAPQQTVQMVHPEVQMSNPVEQRDDQLPPVKHEPVTPSERSLQEKIPELVEPQVVEAPTTLSEPVTPAKEPEPVRSAEPVVAHQSTEAVEYRPVETKPSVSESLLSPAPVQTQAIPLANPLPQELPVQNAKAVPGPDAKADHRWLAESLWRRVAELKRYPSSARLNGQEGKVILRAVIRSDGQLAEVSVQKSSGHQILDAAAIEAVRLACPLHMKHAIGKPEIIVSLPIVYSLAN